MCSEVSGMMFGCDQRETTHHSYYDRIIDNYLSCLATMKLPSGFPSKKDSNQSVQILRPARILMFFMQQALTTDIRYRLRGCAFVVGQNKLLMTLMKCYILISHAVSNSTVGRHQPDMFYTEARYGLPSAALRCICNSATGRSDIL